MAHALARVGLGQFLASQYLLVGRRVSARPAVLVLAPGARATAPVAAGIRALELARALSAVADVSLAVEGDAPDTVAGLPCTAFARNQPGMRWRLPVRAADVVVATPHWPRVTRILRRSRPGWCSTSTFRRRWSCCRASRGSTGRCAGCSASTRWIAWWTRCAPATSSSAPASASATCWLGAMLSERLLDPARHDHDPSLRSLIDVVPFGIPEEPPEHGPVGT